MLLVVSIFLSMASVATAWVNIVNFGPGFLPVIVLEAVFAFIFGYIAIKAFRYRHKSWHQFLVIAGYAFLILFAYASFRPGNSVIQWWFTIPIMAFLVLGKRNSLAFSLAMLAAGCSIFIYNNVTHLDSHWSRGLVNLAFPYLIITAIAYTYEKSRMANEQKLTRLALTDPLTSAYNRKALFEYFYPFSQSHTQFSLAIVDIDHFKSINDNYGHDAGDQVLISTTKLFQQSLSENQVFRLGGEEFVLLIEGEPKQALEQLESIRQRFNQLEMAYQNQTFQVKFSAGLSPFQGDENLTDMLIEADKLLYQAKKSGRDKVCMNQLF